MDVYVERPDGEEDDELEHDTSGYCDDVGSLFEIEIANLYGYWVNECNEERESESDGESAD